MDVLFYSDTAQQYVTTVPERIYMWLALIAAVLLNAATLVTRSALVAYLTWFFSGAAMFYSVFAIWMRQSRPPTEPGVGPSFWLNYWHSERERGCCGIVVRGVAPQ